MKTATERKRDERARRRSEGYVLMQHWVHPKDRERVQAYLERVSRDRGRMQHIIRQREQKR